MKGEISFKIRERMKKGATRIATMLEETETSTTLAAFEAISLCTSFALDRFSPNSTAVNNSAN